MAFWAFLTLFPSTASKILLCCFSSPQVLRYHHHSLPSPFWWEQGCRVLLLSQISTKTSRSSESSIPTPYAHPMLGMDTVILHNQAGLVAWELHLPNTWDHHPEVQTGSSKLRCQRSLALPLRLVKFTAVIKMSSGNTLPEAIPKKVLEFQPQVLCVLGLDS